MARDIPPGHGVLQPCQPVWLQGMRKTDDLIRGQIAMAEVISAQRDIPAGGLAHRCDNLHGARNALRGEPRTRAAAGGAPVLPQRIFVARWLAGQSCDLLLKQAWPDVELDKRQPQLLALPDG